MLRQLTLNQGPVDINIYGGKEVEDLILGILTFFSKEQEKAIYLQRFAIG